MKKLGERIRASFGDNLAEKGSITADGKVLDCLLDDSYDEFFMPKGRTAEIMIELPCREKLGHLVIKENIRCSQRIERFIIEFFDDGLWREIYSGTVVGHKRIVKLNGIMSDHLRIRITDSRCAPTVSFIGVYRDTEA